MFIETEELLQRHSQRLGYALVYNLHFVYAQISR